MNIYKNREGIYIIDVFTAMLWKLKIDDNVNTLYFALKKYYGFRM